MSCGTTSPVQTREIVRRVLPPAETHVQVPVPELQGPRNRDLMKAWQDTRRALEICNGNAAALTEWARIQGDDSGIDR